MAWLLLALLGCPSPSSCGPDTAWSPVFEQCIGVEGDGVPTTSPSTTPTGDTAAASAR